MIFLKRVGWPPSRLGSFDCSVCTLSATSVTGNFFSMFSITWSKRVQKRLLESLERLSEESEGS